MCFEKDKKAFWVCTLISLRLGFLSKKTEKSKGTLKYIEILLIG